MINNICESSVWFVIGQSWIWTTFHKPTRCFLEQTTLPSLLSTLWYEFDLHTKIACFTIELKSMNINQS